MKKKRGRKVGLVDPDADLDGTVNEYEPSDSDDDYDDNEKLLLERAQKGKSLYEDDDYEEDSENEEEVLGVYSSEDDDDDTKISEKEIDDSDIEGMDDEDKLPDSKAWGKRKKNYYHTDYVDEDYGGFAKEGEEEVALMEEKEARTLQSRLAAQLDDMDLSMGLITKTGKKTTVASDAEEEDSEGDSEEEPEEDVIKLDLSKLTKREKLALLQKQSPEFFGLVGDFKERLVFVRDKLIPVLKLIRCSHIRPDLPASQFVSLKTSLTLNYCVNLSFYLLLKKKGINIKYHPITERLLNFRKLLEQLDSLQSQALLDQLDDIIDKHKDIKRPESCSCSYGSGKVVKSKKQLKLLSEMKFNKLSEENEPPKKKSKSMEQVESYEAAFESVKGNSEDELERNDEAVEEGKRAITYQIAKNKGLTPHRKKEQRNPRVKNRNKYRRALIRRKGQVRTVHKEVSKYGGEIFGIKASVIKSRKIK